MTTAGTRFTSGKDVVAKCPGTTFGTCKYIAGEENQRRQQHNRKKHMSMKGFVIMHVITCYPLTW
jgi:hypothetical protein